LTSTSFSRSLRADHAVVEILLGCMARAETPEVGSTIITTEGPGQAVIDR
jgi:hypothetical protein